LLTAPAPSKAIRGVLGKFADLPHEVETEIRGLYEAHRRIAELERQIRKLKNSNLAPEIDKAAIERAVRVAVERERAAWGRKLEEGRARCRQMVAAATSAWQSFDKLKILLEEIEREWANPPAAVAVRDSSINQRLERAHIPQRDRIASAESLNGSLTLSSGERRILSALAQYPQGRSKVQGAVLTGYAPNGGGFNKYLGALRSRALIKGDGDRLTITDTGIETLGSWEPLPVGSALVEYWRSRLGKAERLILETLTQAYPNPLTKEEVAAGAGYEANGGGFNNALGRLRTLELVEGRGEIRASHNLFEAR
jgi:hypothetical protein